MQMGKHVHRINHLFVASKNKMNDPELFVSWTVAFVTAKQTTRISQVVN